VKFFKIPANIIIGDSKNIPLERRIYNLVSFITILISLVCIISNYAINLSVFYNLILILCGIFFSILYILARYKQIYLPWILISLILITLSISWIFNDGPYGSVNYVYLMSLVILQSFLNKKSHYILLGIVLLNLLILNVLFYFYPDIVIKYPNEKIQLYDLLFTICYVSIITSFLFSIIKKGFNKEREIVALQKVEIENHNNEMIDSVEYASIIQQSIFNQERILKKIFYNYFIFWKPRDAVSGDFYWVKQISDKVIIAVADCTGHGVSAAFLSVMGLSFLNEIVRPYLSPGEILNRLRRKIKKSLNQTGEILETKDGMDISICLIDLLNLNIEYAGAFLPLVIVRENDSNMSEYQLIELKPDKQPIGIFPNEFDFRDKTLKLQVNDTIYMFTDGYYDQFGGDKGSKLLSKNFKSFLKNIQNLEMFEQKEEIEKNFNKWKGDYEQLDDVLVLGVKISK
jgi:serine phosphatase RsbU (regulator of sigma subunit)